MHDFANDSQQYLYIYYILAKVGSGISFRKNSAEYARNSFRYSAEESAHSEAFRSLQKSLFRSSERKEIAWKKIVLPKILILQTELTACFRPRHASERNSEFLSLPRKGSEQNSKCLLIFLFHGTEFRVVFSSAEWFRMEFRAFACNFVPWYRIPSIFLLCGTVRNGIPRIFCSAEQPEFRRNKPIVPSIPSSAEYFFCRKLPILYTSITSSWTCRKLATEQLLSG